METEVLWNILAKPEDAKYAFTLNAQALVDKSPQSGLFRALLATNGNEENVQHAAVRFNPAILYKLIHAPESLPTVSADQIYLFEQPLADGATAPKPETRAQEPDNSHLFHELNINPVPHNELAFATEDDDDAVNQDIDAAESKENFFTFDSSTESESEPAQEEANDNPWQEKEPAEPTYFEPAAEQPAQHEPSVAETQPAVEAEQPAAAEPVAEAPKPQLIPLSEQTEYFHQDIDDEIYDEIVSIDDIGLEFINSYKPSEDEGVNSAQHFVFEPELSNSDNGEQSTQQTTPPVVQHQEEIEDIQPYVPPVIVPVNEVMVIKSGIAQYNDEKLPYSFMWWLDKTRSQHSGMYSYQPYANDHKRYQQQANQQQRDYNLNTNTSQGKDMLDELQIQYVENIYTLNAVDDLEKRVAPKSDEPVTKEDKIIDRFIKSEPHIKPPGDIKLDNENKAKRSSEDGDELITETLARIYSEQMLYSKAIAAYKKLMLKYPEKSLYFAGQIEQLEKKPN